MPTRSCAQVSQSWQHGWTVVEVAGEVDVAVAPGLVGVLDLLSSGPVVVDLNRVTFMDASGIRVMLGALLRASSGGGEVRIVSAGRPVQRLLELTGLRRSLPVHGSVAEATRQPPLSRSDGQALPIV